jgi:hypothetical protein
MRLPAHGHAFAEKLGNSGLQRSAPGGISWAVA